jgi:hypothetical protein
VTGLLALMLLTDARRALSLPQQRYLQARAARLASD